MFIAFLANQESQSHEQTVTKDPSSFKSKLGPLRSLSRSGKPLQCHQPKTYTVNAKTPCFYIFYARFVGSVHKATISSTSSPPLAFQLHRAPGSAFSPFACNYHLSGRIVFFKEKVISGNSLSNVILYI